VTAQVSRGLLVTALPQGNESEGMQLTGPPGVVVGLQVDRQRLSMAHSGLLVTAPAVTGHAEVAERAGLTDRVFVRTAHCQRLFEVTGGLAEAAKPGVGGTEHRQRRRFGGPVAGPRGCAAGMAVHGGGIGEVADIRVSEDGGARPMAWPGHPWSRRARPPRQGRTAARLAMPAPRPGW